MTATLTGEVAKRLSFGDESLHTPEYLDVPDLINAMREPSLANFNAAMQHLVNVDTNRFQRMIQVAVSQAEVGDATDLARLKKQLTMIKNNFQAYDVQEDFMSELLCGKPDGSEAQLMGEAQEATKLTTKNLRDSKSANEELRGHIEEEIVSLVKTHGETVAMQQEARSKLQALEAQYLQLQAAKQAKTGTVVSEGANEQLAELNDEARTLESICVEHEALASELEAAIQSEQDELQAILLEVEEMERSTQQGQLEEAPDRFQSAAEWCQELEMLIASLTGVEVLEIGSDFFSLRLTTYIQEQGSVQGSTHNLKLRLEASTSCITSVSLEPADVFVSDIEKEVCGRKGALRMVVQEVHARIGTYKRREALLEEVSGQYSMTRLNPQSSIIRCQLAGGAAEVECLVPMAWPAAGVTVDVTDVQAVSGESMAWLAAELATEAEGKTLLQLLQHGERRASEVLKKNEQSTTAGDGAAAEGAALGL